MKSHEFLYCLLEFINIIQTFFKPLRILMCQRPSYCAVCDRYLVVFPRLGSMLHLTREKHQNHQNHQKHLTIAIDRDGHPKQEKSNGILQTPSNHERQPQLPRSLSTNFLDLPPELRVGVYK